MNKTIKIAYIGGGSKQWARTFMSDLATSEGIDGEICLYDIDKEAAIRNKKIGDLIAKNPKAIAKFKYTVCDTLEQCLLGATFVIISILPGTFEQMASDVHAPEKYGIYQSVGDTVGPGGILRAMRTVPIYEDFAKAIKNCCPNAWVINLTNPMSICTKTLYDVYPQIKAFGCCHEIFHTQELLVIALKDILGIQTTRDKIYTDACGINHFTWITHARYHDIDLLEILPKFIEKYYEEGYFEQKGFDRFAFKTNPFAYGNKLKFNLFQKYGVLPAAGDRHLAEFLNNTWYIKDLDTIKSWQFNQTTVNYRINQRNELIADSILMAEGKKEFELKKSDEECVALLKALLGFEKIVSNVNLPNRGQMTQMPIGSIVETNCVFTNDSVEPVVSRPLPESVQNLVYRNCINIDTCYEGIKERDLEKIFISFINQPLCSTISLDDAKCLFDNMIENTKEYLKPYFNI